MGRGRVEMWERERGRERRREKNGGMGEERSRGQDGEEKEEEEEEMGGRQEGKLGGRTRHRQTERHRVDERRGADKRNCQLLVKTSSPEDLKTESRKIECRDGTVEGVANERAKWLLVTLRMAERARGWMDGDSRQLAAPLLIGSWMADAEWTELSC
ncbi:hypothetical protein BO94DRAFT_46070 [Aspergillus sclerotioniger CBS 115572]|uniref:Uncharacterized protein n=1 Tax=Aspergillus sclerotioniger CBS 115572 TaxID=1450535 RepID=A0A317WUU8_9EURO|nr:hypothetical protein BO94DRAFT_46070 [Aspergillus sclerotioniger CBS 115572]PWY88618.1 hypothetical protein BO94DRAFT_46070 [Aspergillus sclerotioniger CBS 115572]